MLKQIQYNSSSVQGLVGVGEPDSKTSLTTSYGRRVVEHKLSLIIFIIIIITDWLELEEALKII